MTQAAVIGVGSMGQNHARVYQEMTGVNLAAVADIDQARAAQVAGLRGSLSFVDYHTMLRAVQPDVVSVAVPTQLHRQVTLDALDAGCHVLVEKPIAANTRDAFEMIERADNAGRILAVGHVERYNPVITEMKHLMWDLGKLGRVFQIHTRRLGPFPHRVHDIGVIVDLATHDLDIMQFLVGEDIMRVYAETRREVHHKFEDLLAGLVAFSDGTMGVLNVSWLTPMKVREVTVTGERGMLLADLLTQDLYFYENATASGGAWQHLGLLRGVSEGQMTRFQIAKDEPLRLELEAFVALVRGDTGYPDIVTSREALLTLKLAQQLEQSGLTGQVIGMG